MSPLVIGIYTITISQEEIHQVLILARMPAVAMADQYDAFGLLGKIGQVNSFS